MPDDILEGMDKHFEYAGIDVSADDSGVNNDTASGTDNQDSNETVQGTAGNDQIKEAAGTDRISGKADSGTQQRPQEKGQGADPAKPELKAGDLQLRDGTVVKGGAERRWFDQMNVARQELSVTKQQLNTINQKLQSAETRLQAVSEATQAIGMEDPQQVNRAIRLYKDLQANPQAVVTKLLAELKQAGHNVEGIGSAVDNSVLQQLNQRIEQLSEKPQQFDQEQFENEITQEVTQFLGKFPDAVTHEAMIASLMNESAARGQPLSMEQAYFQLKNAAAHHGLDWSQPLLPQVEAKRSQQTQQRAPITNGRPAAAVQPTQEINPVNTPNASEDKDDIIRQAMRDAGYNV